jgi:acetyl esterase/lipase
MISNPFPMSPRFPALVCSILFFGVAGFAAESAVSPASNPETASPLERPTSGNGSVRLTNIPVRQEARTYKVLRQGELKLHFFFPTDWQPSDRRHAMIFFHGYSSATGGSAAALFPQAEYFAARGLVTATVSYRQPLSSGWEPDGTVEDAKSAMRWVRSHARELGVDADQIIAAGGSWGGMLAANLALISGFDASGDDLSVSCEPCALVLFNPAVGVVKERKNAKGELVGEKMAPILLVKKNAPPAIVFFGTEDPRIKDGAEFVAKLRALGNRCDYFTAAKQGHGFFNAEPWTTATALEVDRFLISLGHLSGPPALSSEPLLTAVK